MGKGISKGRGQAIYLSLSLFSTSESLQIFGPKLGTSILAPPPLVDPEAMQSGCGLNILFWSGEFYEYCRRTFLVALRERLALLDVARFAQKTQKSEKIRSAPLQNEIAPKRVSDSNPQKRKKK